MAVRTGCGARLAAGNGAGVGGAETICGCSISRGRSTSLSLTGDTVGACGVAAACTGGAGCGGGVGAVAAGVGETVGKGDDIGGVGTGGVSDAVGDGGACVTASAVCGDDA